MSRIGKLPIKLTSEVQVEVTNKRVTIKGKLGTICISKPSIVKLHQSDGDIHVICSNKSMMGTFRQILNNAVSGVQNCFTKNIKLFGVGYELEDKDKYVRIKVGFSHDIMWLKKSYLGYKVLDKLTLSVFGIEKDKVMQEAASIRNIKKPDSYDGKGIRYENEVLKLKEKKK